MTDPFQEAFKKIFDDLPDDSPLLSLFNQSPDYTYWEDKKGNRYFYTKTKINHNGNLKYVAGIYRYIKTKKYHKLVKQVGFAKKKKAIEWAYKKFEDAGGWKE